MSGTWALLALANAWAAASNAEAPERERASRWEWMGGKGDDRPVLIEVVRGAGRVVRRPGPVRILFESRSATVDPGVVRFEVSEEQDRITISDIYPKRNAWMTYRECLPPQGRRGDFWSNPVWIFATIHAPQGISVTLRSMEHPLEE